MHIPLQTLQYTFTKKPLLVGGKAMEYYGLRKAGVDIDLIVPEEDVKALIIMYPDRVKDLWGDLGVCPFEFEIWRTIVFFDYEYLKVGAIEEDDVLIISLEKLLFMKALAMKVEKYLNDTKLIVNNIIDTQYKSYEKEKEINKKILEGLDVTYIEKRGPQE